MKPTKPQDDARVESGLSALNIPVDRIRLEARREPVVPGHIERLVESIGQIGLLNPITVVAEAEGWLLVAGAHRLAAAKALGWPEIRAVTIEARLQKIAEIDENLIRKTMTTWDEGRALIERRAMADELDKVFGRGGDRVSPEHQFRSSELVDAGLNYEALAAKMGIKKTVLYTRIALAQKITPAEAELARSSGAINNDALMRKIALCEPHIRARMFQIMADAQKVMSFKTLEILLDRRIRDPETLGCELQEAAAMRAVLACEKYLNKHPSGLPQLQGFLTLLFNKHAATHPGQP